MNKEAMTLALEALRNSVDLVIEDAYNAEQLYGNYPTRQGKVSGLKALAEEHKKAIKVLEEALAKQEQGEPMFWYRPVGEDGGYEGPIHNLAIEKVRKECGAWKPLYTTPQPAQKPWVGLMDTDIGDEYVRFEIQGGFNRFEYAVRAIEAKLKEKNT